MEKKSPKALTVGGVGHSLVPYQTQHLVPVKTKNHEPVSALVAKND
jgi:hypothetical protein